MWVFFVFFFLSFQLLQIGENFLILAEGQLRLQNLLVMLLLQKDDAKECFCAEMGERVVQARGGLSS